MSRKNKILVYRLIISFVLWILAIILQNKIDNELIYLLFYILSYLIAGYDIVLGAAKNIISGNLLDEFFLMSVASIGAFLIRIFGDIEYMEAVAIVIFFQIGEVFQGVAVEKSRNAIMSSMNLKVTNCKLENGEFVDVEDVQIGTNIIVRPGEMIPIDSVALTSGVINTASLTGEPLDIEINAGDTVLSGSINTLGPLILKTTKEYYESTACKILDMVENATMKKSKSEKIITKFAHVYTPIVVGFALFLALIVPSILGIFKGFSYALYKDFVYAALTCLVISCPCALVVSVPLTYFAGIGCNAKNKIIVKGGSYLEAISNVDVVVLDKTGTLTKAEFEMTKIYGDEEILRIAKGLELDSTHPLANAINKLQIDSYKFEIKEKPGLGVIGYLNDEKYLCGNRKLLIENNITPIEIDECGSVLYISKGEQCLGAIVLEDIIKEEAFDTVNKLHNLNKRVIVLSGDNEKSVSQICNRLGINEYYYGLLPVDKANKVESLIKSGNRVMFIGDGINDAPVLALSQVGCSMGQIGSDAAIEASDAVILNDDLSSIPLTLRIAKKTKAIAMQNIIFTIGIKILVLLLCAIASLSIIPNFKVPIGLAIFADVGVCVIAVFNAMRALRINKEHKSREKYH